MYVAAEFVIAEMKLNQVSIYCWLVKENVVYLHGEILLSHKKNGMLSYATKLVKSGTVRFVKEASPQKTNTTVFYGGT